MPNSNCMSTTHNQAADARVFHALTPSEVIDITGYTKALDHALTTDDIRNIGITGAYGAGKSSVLRSYEKKQKQSNPKSHSPFIYISLAYFQPQQKTSDHLENDSANEDTPSPQAAHAPSLQNIRQAEKRKNQYIDALEHKIINQLVHQIKPKLITRCTFGKKQNMTRPCALTITVALVYVLFYALHLLSPAITARMQVAMPYIDVLFSPFWATFGLVLFLGIVSCGIWWFFKQGGMAWNITKFSIGSASLEKKDSHDTKSIFDTHLADVVYIFENCGANVVVFEDLDRFDINRIFKKLREINLCVNSGGKKIKFIYMVRDDVFKSVERVKFFDYIIPIVPIITSHNSYDRMRELDLQEYLSDKFMKGLAHYVDDMRLIYNIYNEFMIYRNILQFNTADNRQQFFEKLFSIIVYKNFCPSEYNEDQYLRGVLTSLVKKKDDLVENIRRKYSEATKDIENAIEKSDNEHLQNIDELYTLCLDMQAILSNVNQSYQYVPQSQLHIANSSIPWFTPEGRKAIAMLALESPNALQSVTIQYNSSLMSSVFDMTTMFNTALLNDRKNALENKVVEARMHLRNRITQLQEKERVELHGYTLGRLYTLHPQELDAIIAQSTLEKDKSHLIRFFITNDYIGETYKHYMTHFVGTVLTERDTHFIRNVLEHSPLSLDYPIDNPQGVIDELQERFSQKEILNISLLQYFHSTDARNAGSALYEAFMKCLCGAPDLFRQCATSAAVDYEKLVASANTFVPAFWQAYRKTAHVTEEDFLHYALTSLYVHDTATLDSLNENQEFEKALLEDNNLLLYLINTPDPFHAKLATISQNILHFQTYITHLAYDTSIASLFDAIYEKRLFGLSFANIRLLMEVKYDVKGDAALYGATYSTICSKPDTPLAINICEYMNGFAEVLLEEQAIKKHGIHDPEKDAITFMQHPYIDKKWKDAYASILKTEVHDLRAYITPPQAEQELSEADVTLLELLCTHNRIEHTAQNIATYFLLRKQSIDDWLVQYINSFEDTIVIQSNMFIKDEEHSVCNDIMIAADSINNTQYKQIIQSLNYYYQIPNADINISKEKVDILLEIKAWRLHNEESDSYKNNHEIITIFRDKYQDSLGTLASTFEKEFMACMLENPVLLERDERIILQSANISDDNKIHLLKGIEGAIDLSEATFSREVQEYIIQNKFNTKNLKDIVLLYSDEEVFNQSAIVYRCIAHIDEIISESIPLCYSLLVAVLSAELDDGRKVHALLQSLVGLSCEKVLLATRNISTFKQLHDLRYGKRPRISATHLAEQLLNALEKQDIVSSFKEKDSMYIVCGTKQCSANA